MIDVSEILYLSYFLYEIWVSIIPVSLFFLLFTPSLCWLAHKFYDCRFQWCQVLLPSPIRSIHSVLCSLVVPLVAYTLCVVSSVVHPEISPACAGVLPQQLPSIEQIPTSLFPQIREPSFGKKMMDENLHYRNKWTVHVSLWHPSPDVLSAWLKNIQGSPTERDVR